jgi:hypothetical protein
MTCFSPDQTASTAQTFPSTKPIDGGEPPPISSAMDAGIASRQFVRPAATPSFLCSGVPEWPAVAFAIAHRPL